MTPLTVSRPQREDPLPPITLSHTTYINDHEGGKEAPTSGNHSHTGQQMQKIIPPPSTAYRKRHCRQHTYLPMHITKGWDDHPNQSTPRPGCPTAFAASRPPRERSFPKQLEHEFDQRPRIGRPAETFLASPPKPPHTPVTEPHLYSCLSQAT